MDNPRPEKVGVVSEVRNRFDQSSAAILTEYRGLTVKDLATLRRSLRDVGGEYRIYKNTLVRFAARDLGLDELVSLLEGPTAIAFVEGDAVPVAKALRDYARTNTHLVIKGGVLGRQVMSPADTSALADLPPRDVVLARLAGALAAPMQQFAGLLQALPRNFAYGLKALIDLGGEPGSPTPTAAAEPEPAELEPAAPEPVATEPEPAAPEPAPAEAPAVVADAPEPVAAEAPAVVADAPEPAAAEAPAVVADAPEPAAAEAQAVVADDATPAPVEAEAEAEPTAPEPVAAADASAAPTDTGGAAGPDPAAPTEPEFPSAP